MEGNALFSTIYFAIIVISIFIYVRMSERRKENKRINDELIDNSTLARNKLFDYLRENKTVSESDIDKQKKKILEDPEILKQAVENRQKKMDRKVYERVLEGEKEKKSKEYFDAIIDIFGTNKEIPKQFILDKIEEKYNYNNFESIELFISWKRFDLIDECFDKPNYFRIGYSLKYYNESQYMTLKKDGLIFTDLESKPFKIWKKQRSKSNPKLLNEELLNF